MPAQTDDTLRNLVSPAIVVVGGEATLHEACHEVSRSGVPAKVFRCELGSAATVVAERRPFAVVIPQALAEFDPHEFYALARDVRARLIIVPDDAPTGSALPGFLLGPLLQALEAWTA